MVAIVIKLDLANMVSFKRAARELGMGKARKIVAWSMNDVGNKLYTRVKRQTAKQLGLPYSQTAASWDVQRAHAGSLEYSITTTGKYYSLGRFKPRQFSFGVRAKPWNRMQRFKSAFMLGGEVYARTSKERGPLKKLMGGSIPREMERDAIPFIADAAMDQELPAVIDRKLGQFLPW